MPLVQLETSMGVVKLELFPEKAPITVENFLTYVREGHYDGLIFHRVIGDFAVQGGGYNEKMQMRPTSHPPIKCEAGNGLKNDRGTVAMARTDDPDSATAQFFINMVNNHSLNHMGEDRNLYGYAVFGKVVEGMEVVNRIQRVHTIRLGRFDDVPKEPIAILKASVIEE